MKKLIMSAFCITYGIGSLFSMQEGSTQRPPVLIIPVRTQPASPRTMAMWRVSLSPRKHTNEKLDQCDCLMYYLFCLPCCALCCKVNNDDTSYAPVE